MLSIAPEQDAIEFQSQGYVWQMINRQKVLRRVKDELEANRTNYHVALKDNAPA